MCSYYFSVEDGPLNFVVRQKGGKIFFSWSVNSKCAINYEITRQESQTGPKLFFSNVLEVPQSSCEAPIEPADVYDDLVASQLELGTSYNYCVRGGNLPKDYRSKERYTLLTASLLIILIIIIIINVIDYNMIDFTLAVRSGRFTLTPRLPFPW